jgi:hypothetical protein
VIKDCKDINCPFLGEDCEVTPEECPRKDNVIDEDKAIKVIQRRTGGFTLKVLKEKVIPLIEKALKKGCV